ncbi:MAG: hypothetical protein ABSH47_03205 [Bryobacteraceae bacterium]
MKKRLAAVREYLAGLRQKKLEHELAEGYRANAAQARQLAEELSHVGTEML